MRNLLLNGMLEGDVDKALHLPSFEIPYNMDKKLIDALVACNIPQQFIDCIYMPCRAQDGFTTQRELSWSIDSVEDREYDFLLNYAQRYFPNYIQVLIQGGRFLEPDTIKYYADHGVNRFCVGTYHHAAALKEYNPNFEITLSITMGVQPQDLIEHPEYEEVFDRYVLPFNANRDPKIIDLVPPHYERIIIPNNYCSPICPGIYHWTSTPENLQYLDNGCPRDHNDMKLITTIAPFDLEAFMPHVQIFKLVDRCYNTWQVMQNLCLYTAQEFWDGMPLEMKDEYHPLDFYQRY